MSAPAARAPPAAPEPGAEAPLWRITVDRLVLEAPDADPARALRIRSLVEQHLARLAGGPEGPARVGAVAPAPPELPAHAGEEETAEAVARAVLAAVGGARGR